MESERFVSVKVQQRNQHFIDVLDLCFLSCLARTLKQFPYGRLPDNLEESLQVIWLELLERASKTLGADGYLDLLRVRLPEMASILGLTKAIDLYGEFFCCLKQSLQFAGEDWRENYGDLKFEDTINSPYMPVIEWFFNLYCVEAVEELIRWCSAGGKFNPKSGWTLEFLTDEFRASNWISLAKIQNSKI